MQRRAQLPRSHKQDHTRETIEKQFEGHNRHKRPSLGTLNCNKSMRFAEIPVQQHEGKPTLRQFQQKPKQDRIECGHKLRSATWNSARPSSPSIMNSSDKLT
jgi:hypothetical protein